MLNADRKTQSRFDGARRTALRVVMAVVLGVAVPGGAFAQAQSGVAVTVTGPGGTATQSLPDQGGRFDLTIPLTRNAVNTLTVTATDSAGRTVSHELKVTQLSLDQIVVSQVTTERLSPAQVAQLVADGVIALDNPANFNVSTFDIVLTIADKPVPISVAVPTPIAEPETGWERYRMPTGDGAGGGGKPAPLPTEIIVFDEPVAAATPDRPALRVPGVIVIEGNIKSLKEFYTVRLLLMNTSGLFTLKDVVSSISFPDGGLTSIAPADGLISFGDILPGNGGVPGQAERQFIVRGDTIGVRHVNVAFGGTVAGPGIPDDSPVPFNGAAAAQLEVKGPPTFKVKATHPSAVDAGVPYEFKVEITNTGEIPALYTSLDLSVGAAGALVTCDTTGTVPSCWPSPNPDRETRTFGDIYPGQTVAAVFTILPSTTGTVASCLGVADQNISLEVFVGTIGCLVGQAVPEVGVPDGTPTVTVVPAPNAQGVSTAGTVVAFFSQEMLQASITTGTGGTFNVFDRAGAILPGRLHLDRLNGKTAAIWQFDDGTTSRLAPNAEYTVGLTRAITNQSGVPLFSAWTSRFTTTGDAADDVTPPSLTLSVEPPVNPSFVLPGQLVRVDAYAADQGSGVVRVELRIKDLDTPGSEYVLVDRKVVFAGDAPPFIFTIDSARLVAGHAYQLMATAYDAQMNGQTATLSLAVASSAAPPTVVLPSAPADGVPQGISVSLVPEQVTGGVRDVRYFLDDVPTPFSTVTLPPYQASLGTVTLALGSHTIRVVAVDALNQEGSATFAFTLVPNPNRPQVALVGTTSGATYIVGSSFVVNSTATDPVGIASVTSTVDGQLVARGETPFTVATAALGVGVHTIVAEAVNLLGVTSTVVSAFTVAEPPHGDPPAAPTITGVSGPSGGTTTITGRSAAAARIDVTNTTRQIAIGVTAGADGYFSVTIAAAVGDLLSIVAYDYSVSQLPSTPSTATVQAPPALTGLAAAPASVRLTAVGQWNDLVVTASYTDGTTAVVTTQAALISSDPTVATVSGSGRVVARSSGTTAVSASYGGLTATTSVVVDVVTLTSISVDPAVVSFGAIGQSRQLAVTAHFSDGSTHVVGSGLTFASGNAAVATVTSGGLVQAMADGSSTLSVYLPGAPPASVSVNVDTASDTPPQVSVLSPVGGATVAWGDVVRVIARATDAVGGVTGVSLTVTGTGGVTLATESRAVAPASTDTTVEFSFIVPASQAVGAQLTFSVGATDTGGHSAVPVIVPATVVDHEAPTVTIAAPAGQTRYRYGDTIVLRITASDPAGIASVRFATTGAFTVTGTRALSPVETTAAAEFEIVVPTGLPVPDVRLFAYATDTSGNEGAAPPVSVFVSSADTVAPSTEVTSIADAAGEAAAVVTYRVTAGLDDLRGVELYFRRNGIGTFNRFTDADHGNPTGRFVPQSGDVGTIPFDSTKMGGDGTYEFYTVGVDLADNRETAPDTPDSTMAFNAGTVWTVITTPAAAGEGDTTYDDRNIRVSGTTFRVSGAHTFRNVELLNGAVLAHAPATMSDEYRLDLTAWSLTVDTTSRIDTTGLGYLGGDRNGNDCTGQTLGNVDGAAYRAAGSYGGAGAAWDGTSNPIYGDLTSPGALGSGGSCGTYGRVGGNGGGWIAIHAINLAIDGSVIADGGAGSPDYEPGSGSGGAVNVVCSTVSGRGVVTANGGANQVGGGGGRIAIRYIDMSTMDPSSIRALGGQGTRAKGANGTVFLLSQEAGNGTLVIDGQGAATSFTAFVVPTGYVFDHIRLRNNARVTADVPVVAAGTLSLTGGSTLTHSLESVAGLTIRAARVEVDETSSIDVSARGYRGGNRDGNPRCEGLTLGALPGATSSAAGAYGGFGAAADGTTNPPYGQPGQAVHLGSGGGCGPYGRDGGNGGGRISIEASDSVVVHGRVAADGGLADPDYQPGGGSGGSISIRTSMLRGAGTITANGAGPELGGGGGRIAIRYDSLGQPGDDLAGLRNVTAFGGRGSRARGSAGTVLVQRTDQVYGDLYVDDGMNGETSGVWTPLTTLGFGKVTAVTADSFTTDGGVRMIPNGLVGLEVNPNLRQAETYKVLSNTETTVTVDTTGKPPLASPGDAAVGDTYAGLNRFDNVFFRRGGFLTLGDRLVVTDQVRIDDYGTLTHFDATLAFEPHLDLTAGTVHVTSTGSIDVDGRGYLGGGRQGNGCNGRTLGNAEGAVYRSAGSYGGPGGLFDGGPANPVYGSLTDPAALGSGGSCGTYGRVGGDGGGWMVIRAGDLIVNGRISANGVVGSPDYEPGSGSGGTVNITATNISGMGTISADGGANQVGGGGGRIAVRFLTSSMTPGQFSTQGGHGSAVTGANGTLFLKQDGQGLGDLVIDGGGQATPNSRTPIPPGYVFDNLTIRNRAVVVADTPIVVNGTLALTGDSVLTHSLQQESGLSIQAARVDIDETSAIDVSARGYRGGHRDGNGLCEGLTLGGLPGAAYRAAGTYGGFGARVDGASNLPYGQPNRPVYLGSGGSCGPHGRVGGHGGGLVSIRASESVTVNGRVAADGGAGSVDYEPGAGSGGSVDVTTSLLRGTGTISANGGGLEAGGGGGRIAIRYEALGAPGDDLDGLRRVTAFGGHGTGAWGSAGTVWTRRSDQADGDLHIDDNMTGSSTAPMWTPLTPLGFGRVAALTADTLTLDGTMPVAINGLVGLQVNPNIQQDRFFTVTANTGSTVTLNVTSLGASGLADVAAVGDTYAGVYRFDNVYFRRGGFLVTGDQLVANGTMRLDDGGRLTHFNTTLTYEPRLALTVGTLDITAGGAIDTDGRGYLGGGRDGNGCTGRTLGNAEGALYRSAGSYGGAGGVFDGGPTNPLYGDPDDPTALGSGGSCGPHGRVGGNGGGWVSIRADFINLAGRISANGGVGSSDYQPGSGSGGTIRIVTEGLFGSGTIAADGGANEVGGGGGRVRVSGVDPAGLTVTIRAAGGAGSHRAGAPGSVVIRK